MLSSMVYFVVVALLLSAAALAAEHVAWLMRRSTRWIWVAALVASVLIPAAISSVSIQLPRAISESAATRGVALSEATSVHLPSMTWGTLQAIVPPSGLDVDSLARRGWIVASLALLAGFAASGTLLFIRQRRWQPSTVAGHRVRVAPDAGPAVVGLLRPRIVVPRWLLTAPIDQQRWVIAHEAAHLQAGDPALLTLALALLVIMPWNLPLWWQLRRLRHAIEVDCDARVLRSAHSLRAVSDGGGVPDADNDAEEYGMTLIEVGRRRSRTLGAVAAMSESHSLLERRIRIMLAQPGKWLRLSAIPLGALALTCVAMAAQITPPPAPAQQTVTLPTSVLDQYAGFYRFSDTDVMSIRRDGTHLVTQMTGQGPVSIYPESQTEFVARIPGRPSFDARVTFVQDAPGQTTSLVLHQNGRNIPAPRIDAATAAQINANVAARVQSNTPNPGSEAALRHLIEGLLSGNPDYAAMSPGLAQATREQLPALHQGLSRAGAIQSIQFLGVAPNGADTYDVRQQNGVTHWVISLDASGKVAGAFVTPGP